MIRREAERYGVSIHHSELVGLIPQDALVDAAQWYMQLDQFEPDQILEYRLAAAQAETDISEASKDPSRINEFLDALAAGSPTPGGGSAAAFSGAAGAALVAMVSRLTIGKAKYADVEAQMQSTLKQVEKLRADLSAAVQQDAAAFEAVMAAFRLPKDTDEQRAERSRAIQDATLNAAQVPLEVAGMAVDVIEQAVTVVTHGNVNAISDGATGAALARAALNGAGYNVRINALSLKDSDAAGLLVEKLDQVEQRTAVLEDIIRTQLVERGGLTLA
jgi:glutamate formiminotransferase/formiminotetrahydrofolate cyclodeaminase